MMLRQTLSVVLFCFLVDIGRAANFTQCKAKIMNHLPFNITGQPDLNGTILNLSFPDPVYHGTIRGFRFNHDPQQRPLMLTQQGCLNACGSSAELNSVEDAFSIMTTWVLPMIALLSQLPYDSPSEDRIQNLEAFGNWVGSPAAALTTTIWNILTIRRCRKLSESRPYLKDTLFILSCINQYEYPRRTKEQDNYNKRDIALLRGVLYPLVKGDEKLLPDSLRDKLKNLTAHLAFQLRLQRRKGMHALWINFVWFLLSFVFSIVDAFADLGDNTTAHSLALGLLLSWMPTLVLATIIDRNPSSATRCGVLIERWLYNVDALFAEYAPCSTTQANRRRLETPIFERKPLPLTTVRLLDNTSEDDNKTFRSSCEQQDDFRVLYEDIERQAARELLIPHTINTTQWQRGVNTKEFTIRDFVGQGRRMRYSAVADTVLKMMLDSKPDQLSLPGGEEAEIFQKRLPCRPRNWYLVWLISQLLVGTGYATAFVVSFRTPTIGLGCRALSYTVWYIFSFFSWALLGIWQEPPSHVRVLAQIPNTLASLALFGVMMLQTNGGLNKCRCASSTFGSSNYGGYMDFEDGKFYFRAYPVREVWALATAFGLTGAVAPIVWFWIRWRDDSDLWEVDEDGEPDVIDGIDLQWLI